MFRRAKNHPAPPEPLVRVSVGGSLHFPEPEAARRWAEHLSTPESSTVLSLPSPGRLVWADGPWLHLSWHGQAPVGEAEQTMWSLLELDDEADRGTATCEIPRFGLTEILPPEPGREQEEPSQAWRALQAVWGGPSSVEHLRSGLGPEVLPALLATQRELHSWAQRATLLMFLLDQLEADDPDLGPLARQVAWADTGSGGAHLPEVFARREDDHLRFAQGWLSIHLLGEDAYSQLTDEGPERAAVLVELRAAVDQRWPGQ